MVRPCTSECVCMRVVCVQSGPFRDLCSTHTGGPRCLSQLAAHTLPRLAALAVLAHKNRRRPHLCFWTKKKKGADSTKCCSGISIWPVASRPVWSPTSFSALVGRKWPNAPAPVLRWTHCCHIKAQICTVAQLKFPTLPTPPRSQPHTLGTNGRTELLFVWAPWRE